MSKTDDLKAKTSLPLIVAPMFLVSTPAMALAACAEGVVGSFPALNQRTGAGFEEWLVRMNAGLEDLRQKNPEKTIAPYAVNLICNEKNFRLRPDLALCVKHKVPIVITSLGITPDVAEAIHSYGGIVLHDVTNVYHAKKALEAGVDGLIAVAAGAGGHAGTMNPIALISEIRQFYDGLLVLSGCMSSGADILSAEAMGADFAYMGTRFITTAESSAAAEYKKMVCDATAADIIYTSAISGVPANFMRQSMEKAGLDIAKIKREGAQAGKLKGLSGTFNFWKVAQAVGATVKDIRHAYTPKKFMQKVKENALAHEFTAWRDYWSAGQGVSNIHDIPTVAELIGRLKREYAGAQQRMSQKIGKRSEQPQL